MEKLSTKLLLDQPRMAVYVDVVELPSGLKTPYVHTRKINDVAMIIAVDGSGKYSSRRNISIHQTNGFTNFQGVHLKPPNHSWMVQQENFLKKQILRVNSKR